MIVVTGPALVLRRLLVPAGGVLRYRLSLASGETEVVVSTLRIRDAESTREMAETRLSRSPFGCPSRDVEVDLSPWSGRTVDLELEVYPLPCRSSVATVVVERAGDLRRPRSHRLVGRVTDRSVGAILHLRPKVLPS